MAQSSFPDLDQMSLFAECLPDNLPKQGLEEILNSGNSSALGSFIREIKYPELRRELLHCGFELPEVSTKDKLLGLVWSEMILRLKAAKPALA